MGDRGMAKLLLPLLACFALCDVLEASPSLEAQVISLQKQLLELNKARQRAECRPDFKTETNYTFTGQGRDMPKNATEPYPDAMSMKGWINVHSQHGNLLGMKIHVADAAQDAYEFVCTVTDLHPQE